MLLAYTLYYSPAQMSFLNRLNSLLCLINRLKLQYSNCFATILLLTIQMVNQGTSLSVYNNCLWQNTDYCHADNCYYCATITTRQKVPNREVLPTRRGKTAMFNSQKNTAVVFWVKVKRRKQKDCAMLCNVFLMEELIRLFLIRL